MGDTLQFRLGDKTYEIKAGEATSILLSEIERPGVDVVHLEASKARLETLRGKGLGSLIASGALLRLIAINGNSETVQRFYYRHLGQLLACPDVLVK